METKRMAWETPELVDLSVEETRNGAINAFVEQDVPTRAGGTVTFNDYLS